MLEGSRDHNLYGRSIFRLFARISPGLTLPLSAHAVIVLSPHYLKHRACSFELSLTDGRRSSSMSRGRDRSFGSVLSFLPPCSSSLRHRPHLPDDRYRRSLSLVNRSVSFPSTGLSAVHFSPLPAFLFLSSPSLPLLIFTRPLDTPQPHSQSQPCPPRLLLQLPSIQESASFVVK